MPEQGTPHARTTQCRRRREAARSAGVASKRCDERDRPGDVLVEVVNFFDGNPKLIDAGASYPMRRELPQVHGVHFKAQDVSDVSRSRVLGVPVARELRRVVLVEDRIEDRLTEQARREATPSALG